MESVPSIRLETPLQEEVMRLLQQADEHAAMLYPAESRFGLGADTLAALKARFFVARLGGRAVGCGGFVQDAGGAAELKRLSVEDSARGRGVGQFILRMMEDAARREGVGLLRFETGVKSVAALRLDRRSGYRERGPFGGYGPDPLSLFLEKELSP